MRKRKRNKKVTTIIHTLQNKRMCIVCNKELENQYEIDKCVECSYNKPFSKDIMYWCSNCDTNLMVFGLAPNSIEEFKIAYMIWTEYHSTVLFLHMLESLLLKIKYKPLSWIGKVKRKWTNKTIS